MSAIKSYVHLRQDLADALAASVMGFSSQEIAGYLQAIDAVNLQDPDQLITINSQCKPAYHWYQELKDRCAV